MKTRVLKIDPLKIDTGIINEAARCIRAGALVAFPTETVYGLGASALDAEACAGIFEAKERPLDDPLIVHIAEEKDLAGLVRDLPAELEKVLKRFWPGPLTVVLKKKEIVPGIVTAGLDTVAVRVPANEIARSLIIASGAPIAAPSANLFSRPSPTSAKHVVDDLGGRIDIVLDGGRTEIGLESTVIELEDGRIRLLRPGGISLEAIKSVVGNIEIFQSGEELRKSPGKYSKHYSPRAELMLIKEGPHQTSEVLSAASEKLSRGLKVGIMGTEEHASLYKGYNLKLIGPRENARVCASRLFHLLREFDSEGVDVIVAEGTPEKGLGHAVMDRLRKAQGK